MKAGAHSPIQDAVLLAWGRRLDLEPAALGVVDVPGGSEKTVENPRKGSERQWKQERQWKGRGKVVGRQCKSKGAPDEVGPK